jgi:hypothetical protein
MMLVGSGTGLPKNAKCETPLVSPPLPSAVYE